MISLYGKLARDFQKKYSTQAKNINIKVRSAAEMLRALNANFPGFNSLIGKKSHYKVVNGNDINADGLDIGELNLIFTKDQDWHIMPVAAGASGDAKVVIGVGLMAIGGYTGSAQLVLMGASFVFSGAMDHMTRTPDTDGNGGEAGSFLYSGPMNLVEPGSIIPFGYGEVFCGSTLVSASIKSKTIHVDWD